jgi:hypothetical protein
MRANLIGASLCNTLLPYPTASGPARFHRKRPTLVLLLQHHGGHYDSLLNRHTTLGLKNVSNAVLGKPSQYSDPLPLLLPGQSNF